MVGKRAVAIGIRPAVLHAEREVRAAPAAPAAAAASPPAARGAGRARRRAERLGEPEVDVVRPVAGRRGAVVVLRVAGLVRQRVVLQQRLRRGIDPGCRDLVVREGQARERIDQRDVRAGEIARAPRGRRHDGIRLVQVPAEAAVVVEEERLARLPLVDAGDLERPADVQREPLVQIGGLLARVRRERVGRGVERRAGQVVRGLQTDAIGAAAAASHREPAGDAGHPAAAGPPPRPPMPPPGPPPWPPMPPPPGPPPPGPPGAPPCGNPPATNPPCSPPMPGMPPGWPSGPNPPMPPNMPSPPRPPPGPPSPPIIMKSIGLTWPVAPDAVRESPDVPTENPGGRLSCAATMSSDSSTALTPAC